MIRRKTAVIISIFICLAAVAGGFFASKYFDEEEAKKRVSDAEFLVEGGKWKQNGSDGKVVWEFKKDGTCRLTTNGDEYFDCQWYLKDNLLGIKTAWLTDLEDEFTIRIDHNKYNFTITSKSDNKTSEFHAENALLLK